jgi:phospholipid/cholesterol/gamma-HCH transport system substrate-binding protein
VAALVAAAVAAALLMFGGVGGYTVSITLDNAGQLVKGNQVKVGGVPVGEVRSIELAPDRRARLELSVDDDELTPLHRGTVATVRSHSLSGIASRYVALSPGPNDRPEIADGGAIPAEDGRPAVDLDQVLNTLDPQTQRELQTLVRRGGELLDEHAREANAGLEALNPALSQSAATARELMRDERAFERFLVESADVVSQVASRPRDLEELTGNALAAVGALADRSEELESSLEQLPPTLRRGNTALVNFRLTARELRGAVREARPAAPLLSAVLHRLRPVARDARPVVARLRRTIRRPGRSNDLLDALRGLPSLSSEAVPALRSTDGTLRDALPVVQDARPYTPDLIGGLLNGFGGSTAGYYDANGHYARISFQASVYALTGGGSLVELPQLNGLTGYRKQVVRRCPGAATQPLPDGSNPYLDRDGFPCDPADTAREEGP